MSCQTCGAYYEQDEIGKLADEKGENYAYSPTLCQCRVCKTVYANRENK